MTKQQAIQLFSECKVRSVWDDEQEKWFFSIVDVVDVLTDSTNPADYLKKLKQRDPQLKEGWGQIVTSSNCVPLTARIIEGQLKL